MNPAAALVALVLTQTALMSLSDPSGSTWGPGVSGPLFGTAAAGIGAGTARHARRALRTAR